MKTTFTFITVLFITLAAFAQFPEDFQGTTFPPTGWQILAGDNGLGTVETWTLEGGPNYYARIIYEDVTDGYQAEDWLVSPQFTVDASTPYFVFQNAIFNSTDYGSTLTVRVSTISQTTHADFTIVDTQTETDIYIAAGNATQSFAGHSVDLSAYAGQTIYVAIVWSNDDGDVLAIDNIDMVAGLPDAVINPSPADNVLDVVIDTTDVNSVTVTWQAATTGATPSSYDVYFGTDENNLGALGFTNDTTLRLTQMLFNTTYYWKIVAKNGFGEALNSTIWEFTTGPEYTPQSIFFDDFNDQDVSDWTLIDADNDGNNWADQFVINHQGNPLTPVSLISRSWATNPLTPNNWAISPVVDLSSITGNIHLKYKTKVSANAFDNEKYGVYIGTASDIASLMNAPISLVETLGVPEDSGLSVNHTIDISSMAGESQVHVAFRHFDVTNQDWISIDDVEIVSYSVASTNNQNMISNVSIFPTIVTNYFTIKSDGVNELKNFTIFDANGRELITKNLSDLQHFMNIDVSNLSSGVYFIEINAVSGKLIRKIIKK